MLALTLSVVVLSLLHALRVLQDRVDVRAHSGGLAVDGRAARMGYFFSPSCLRRGRSTSTGFPGLRPQGFKLEERETALTAIRPYHLDAIY